MTKNITSEVTATISWITPTEAAEMLERNGKNRPISNVRVKRYADEMADGSWLFNGDPVRWDTNDDLVDGQHRLTACVASGRPLRALIVRGLDPSAFTTIDTNKTRSLTDALAVACSPKHGTTISAAIRLLVQWESGVLVVGTHHHPYLSNAAGLDVVKAHPGLVASALFAHAHRRAFITPGAACFMHYLFSGRDSAAADAFFGSLANGEMLAKGDPVYALRDRLINDHHAGLTGSQHRHSRIEMTFRAWNAYRSGNTIKRLRSYGTLPRLSA